MDNGVPRAYCEVIRERTSWLNGTLARTNNTVHLSSAILVETMEVQTRSFVAKLVQYIDHNAVSHICSDVRYGPLAVDPYDRSIEKAIRVGSNPRDVEIVCDGGGMGEPAEAKDKNARGREHFEDRELKNE